MDQGSEKRRRHHSSDLIMDHSDTGRSDRNKLLSHVHSQIREGIKMPNVGMNPSAHWRDTAKLTITRMARLCATMMPT